MEPQMNDKEITLTLNVVEVNGLLQVLGQMPVVSLVLKIQQQAQAQVAQAEEAPSQS